MKRSPLSFAPMVVAIAALASACVGGELPAPDPAERTDTLKFEWANDVCVVHELYGDGRCDRLCDEPDPDCEGEPEPEVYDFPSWEPEHVAGDLEEWEAIVCSRFDDTYVPLHELAEAVCVAREGTELTACVTECVDLAEAGVDLSKYSG